MTSASVNSSQSEEAPSAASAMACGFPSHPSGNSFTCSTRKRPRDSGEAASSSIKIPGCIGRAIIYGDDLQVWIIAVHQTAERALDRDCLIFRWNHDGDRWPRGRASNESPQKIWNARQHPKRRNHARQPRRRDQPGKNREQKSCMKKQCEHR